MFSCHENKTLFSWVLIKHLFLVVSIFMCGSFHAGIMWEAEFLNCIVSIVIRTYSLGYWIWHISAGFCFVSMKSMQLTLNCLSVTVLGCRFWGGYFSVQERNVASLEFTVREVRYWSRLWKCLLCRYSVPDWILSCIACSSWCCLNRGWTRWSQDVPFNLSHSVILGFLVF